MKKITNKILYAILASTIILGTFVVPTANLAIAQEEPDPILKVLKVVKPLSKAEEQRAIQIAVSDAAVQKIINGKPWKFVAYNFVGNLYTTPITAYPEIHLFVDDTTQITAVVDLQSQSVMQVLEAPIEKAASVGSNSVNDPPAYAIDAINIANGSINGLLMTHKGLSYTTPGPNGATLFLVNANEKNANQLFLCDPNHVADSYFTQSGVWYAATTVVTAWADTSTSCSLMATSVPYVNLHTYQFSIFVSGSSWVTTGKDLNTGQYFLVSRQGVTNNTFQTPNYHTSVWMENSHLSTQSSWYTQFGSNPVAQAKYSTNGGVNWNNWTSDSRNDKDCSGNDHVYPYDSTKEVISGSLVSGSTASWNVQRMATIYPAC